jgi:hypothetical protein
MTTPANLERRDLAAGVVGLVLVLSLLWSLREVLSPPLLLRSVTRAFTEAAPPEPGMASGGG